MFLIYYYLKEFVRNWVQVLLIGTVISDSSFFKWSPKAQHHPVWDFWWKRVVRATWSVRAWPAAPSASWRWDPVQVRCSVHERQEQTDMRGDEAYIGTWQEGTKLRCSPAPEFHLKLYLHLWGIRQGLKPLDFNLDEIMFAPANQGKAAFLHRAIHSAV